MSTSSPVTLERPATGTSVLREGAVAGLLGASVVALWFFVFDLVR